MEIRSKLYPYPVLASFTNDYKIGSFDAEISIKRDGYNLHIDFNATLTSAALANYISMGSAKYVYHIECAQTGFRTVIQTSKETDATTLLSKSINGKVQICPFVVAIKDITDYSSIDFHDDYQGASFVIETGCILAVGKMVTIDISKDIDDLANTPSIFNIIKNPDETCKEMLVDMTQRKIIIKLPLTDYYSYKALNSNVHTQSLLNSLTVIPTLVYILGELKTMSPQERGENSESAWYKVISNVLETQFNCDIESEQFSNMNILELAQKMINDPISDAFHVLTSTFDSNGGDE